MDLFDRCVRARGMKQVIDRAEIDRALSQWVCNIGGPPNTKVLFPDTINGFNDLVLSSDHANAADSKLAIISMHDSDVASDIRRVKNILAGRQTARRRDSMIRMSLLAIRAHLIGDRVMAREWLPLLEAFEAGAYFIRLGYACIEVIVIPHVIGKDAQNRLHCETGPALEWVRHTAYYWHGTYVPREWIMHRDRLTPNEVFRPWRHAEQRRAGCEIIGWHRVLDQIDARLIDEDGDPQIGVLYEGQIPGADPCGFLKVTCGTGRTFVIPVPAGMKTAIEAQAWMQGVTVRQWKSPEVRG